MADPAENCGQWLAAARAGSTEALGKLLQSCRNYLLLAASQELDSQLHAKGAASDLVQETFLEAQRDFARFNGATEAELLAWLRRVLLNNAANFTRHYHAGKRQVNREVVLDTDNSAQAGGPGLADPMPTPSSEAVEREQAEALQQALARLPDDYRQVIVLRYLESRSFEEIGVVINRSADAVRKHFSRAMRRLRQEWRGPS
jgi:RNA polymerase sigma-70 factor, ECF subfamily